PVKCRPGTSSKRIWTLFGPRGANVGLRLKRQKPRICGAFVQSGRQDLNLRPPGPQPGALPDCATPRFGSILRRISERATGVEPVPRAWKAPVQPLTPRQQVGQMVAGVLLRRPVGGLRWAPDRPL